MNALLQIIEMSEDRGERAVLQALERIGVLSFDRVKDCLVFRSVDVGAEALHREIQRAREGR